MERRFSSFAEFWPYYVAQHLHPVNRALHFLGTSLAIACLASTGASPWALPLAPLAGYGLAWAGHVFFERNRPATFTYPLWSLRGDLKMYLLMWAGRMDEEISRAREPHPAGA
jgi:hypothetical protein